MQSKWFEYKEEVCNLRKQGVSMTIIERRYGIPRSTLSGWFKDISLTEADRTRLMKNKLDSKPPNKPLVRLYNNLTLIIAPC